LRNLARLPQELQEAVIDSLIQTALEAHSTAPSIRGEIESLLEILRIHELLFACMSSLFYHSEWIDQMELDWRDTEEVPWMKYFDLANLLSEKIRLLDAVYL